MTAQVSLNANGIKLLVRADDFGSTHAANLACIDAYRNGIVRSVEVMVPCPWFDEACALLSKNPDLDVGVHLVLTSEWLNYRWRPLTACPSITDVDGYFFLHVWDTAGIPRSRTLLHANWQIGEVETELRAQIELALARLPQISHLSAHMGWDAAHPSLSALFSKLEIEYGLESTAQEPISYMGTYDKTGTHQDQVESFISALRRLTPGTWLFLEHPAYDHPEMQALRCLEYDGVGKARAEVTQVLTSRDVLRAVQELGIALISYQDRRALRP